MFLTALPSAGLARSLISFQFCAFGFLSLFTISSFSFVPLSSPLSLRDGYLSEDYGHIDLLLQQTNEANEKEKEENIDGTEEEGNEGVASSNTKTVHVSLRPP
jgi:hypothetical protein